MEHVHQPVLLKETLEYLNVKKNKNYIDATIDGAGLAEAILEKNGPAGSLLGLEWDLELLKKAEIKLAKFKNRSVIVHSNFINLTEIISRNNFKNVAGIVFDLGVSNFHFKYSGRGFSFQKNEFLDMRFNPNEQKITAAEIVNTYSSEKLAKIIKDYSQERYWRKITSAIVKARIIKPIKTTSELVKLIINSVPLSYQRQKIHPATRTFQAIRLAVNQELENLQIALPKAFKILQPEGRLVVISFHFLEDKIVKEFFKNKKAESKILTKKPIQPTLSEINLNPKSRSARLRALQKI